MNYPHLTKASETGLNMSALQAIDPDLHDALATNYNIPADGNIKGARLPQAIADRLERLLDQIERKRLNDEAKKERDDFNQRMKDNAQKERDRLAAIARLDEYSRVRGLLSSDHNIKVITDFIADAPELKTLRGRWTAQTIDIAVSFLGPKGTDELEWAPPQIVAPSHQPPQTETLGKCSDGLSQLPLNTVPARYHSVAQLKDLDTRQRAARGPVKSGWHGGGSIV
jgi:hypothetical protein